MQLQLSCTLKLFLAIMMAKNLHDIFLTNPFPSLVGGERKNCVRLFLKNQISPRGGILTCRGSGFVGLFWGSSTSTSTDDYGGMLCWF